MARDGKRLNHVGIRLSDRERDELDALTAAYAIGDSCVIRAALELFAQVTVGGRAPQDSVPTGPGQR